jgi:hypothetical protein
MELVNQLDSASCKATSEIDRFIRPRFFTLRSKAVAESHHLRACFVFPRSLNHRDFSKRKRCRTAGRSRDLRIGFYNSNERVPRPGLAFSGARRPEHA